MERQPENRTRPFLFVVLAAFVIFGLLVLVGGERSLNSLLFSGYLSVAMLNVWSPLATLGLVLTELKAAAWRSLATGALTSVYVFLAARSGSLWMGEMEPLLWCGVLLFSGGGLGAAAWLVLQNRGATH